MRVARVVLAVSVLTLAASAGALALDISEDVQPTEGEVGTPYSFQFEAEEGCLPYRFSLSSGYLPPGLTLPQDGKLTGTPTQAGVFDFFVAVEDGCNDLPSQGRFTMKVLPDLAVATTSLPRPQPGQPYTAKLAATGLEQGWDVTWVLLSGTLPPGLTLAADGTISGTASAAGTWTFVIRVKELFRRYGDRQLTLVVAAPLTLKPPGAEVGEIGLPYRTGLDPVGGLGPMRFAVAAGSLPAGLALDPVTGFVQGTPQSAGTFPVTFTVTDVGGERAAVDARLRIAPRLTVRTTRLPRGARGDTFAARLETAGGVGPFRWRIVRGALPAGLRLDPSTGRLSGVPRTAGRYRITFEARDRLGARAQRTLTLPVSG